MESAYRLFNISPKLEEISRKSEVYERLIEDICGDNEARVIECLIEVYTSWIDGAISNYNTDFYYQSLDYIYECYKEGRVLE